MTTILVTILVNSELFVAPSGSDLQLPLASRRAVVTRTTT